MKEIAEADKSAQKLFDPRASRPMGTFGNHAAAKKGWAKVKHADMELRHAAAGRKGENKKLSFRTRPCLPAPVPRPSSHGRGVGPAARVLAGVDRGTRQHVHGKSPGTVERGERGAGGARL